MNQYYTRDKQELLESTYKEIDSIIFLCMLVTLTSNFPTTTAFACVLWSVA
jgi:hypothetical protein